MSWLERIGPDRRISGRCGYISNFEGTAGAAVFCLASRCGGTVVVGGRREAAQDLDDRPDRQGPVVPTSQTCFS